VLCGSSGVQPQTEDGLASSITSMKFLVWCSSIRWTVQGLIISWVVRQLKTLWWRTLTNSNEISALKKTSGA